MSPVSTQIERPVMKTQEPLNLPDYLTVTEAAKLLRVTPRTLANWRADGQGPSWSRLGRQILYRRQSVLQYINAREGYPR
jgi:excisionase family DNA binding protein